MQHQSVTETLVNIIKEIFKNSLTIRKTFLIHVYLYKLNLFYYTSLSVDSSFTPFILPPHYWLIVIILETLLRVY